MKKGMCRTSRPSTTSGFSSRSSLERMSRMTSGGQHLRFHLPHLGGSLFADAADVEVTGLAHHLVQDGEVEVGLFASMRESSAFTVGFLEMTPQYSGMVSANSQGADAGLR